MAKKETLEEIKPSNPLKKGDVLGSKRTTEKLTIMDMDDRYVYFKEKDKPMTKFDVFRKYKKVTKG